MDVSGLAERLSATGYLADDALATVAWLALDMQRPLLLEGEPGTGKTALAEAVAEALGHPLIRLQCYEGIDASQALFDCDFPPQVLHLRALEATGGASLDADEAEKSLYDERFLLARPVLRALKEAPAVPLVDEVDRADDEFEAFCSRCSPPGRSRCPSSAPSPPACRRSSCSTSNRTRELHDALKRRCLYHWIDHPGLEREVAILRSRAPEVPAELARQVAAVVQQLRSASGDEQLLKPPGVAESLDWACAAPAGRDDRRPGAGRRDAGRAAEVPRGRGPSPQGAGEDARAVTTTLHSPEEVLLAFAGALRHAGLPVTHDRATTFVDAVARLGLVDPAAVWGAGRATLCAGPDDLDRFDNVFAAWWSADEPPATAPEGASRTSTMALDPRDGRGAGEEGAEAVRAAASTEEVLRHRDVAGLSAADKALLDDLIARLEPRLPRRRARRRTPSARGEVDARRTLRATLRQHGEPAQVLRRRPATRPRRVVMLVDVSGSMAPYAEALLRAAHRWVRAGEGQVEVFTLGTRFTRVTPALTHRDPGVALDAAGRAVPDWSGGTRLGETLRAFCNRWGQRGLARGAVVVVFSDGWERGHYVMLGEQVARLRRLARRVVWANPHRGRPGYEQVQQGVVAVLPHVDDFVAGHSLASWAQVGEVVARA